MGKDVDSTQVYMEQLVGYGFGYPIAVPQPMFTEGNGKVEDLLHEVDVGRVIALNRGRPELVEFDDRAPIHVDQHHRVRLEEDELELDYYFQTVEKPLIVDEALRSPSVFQLNDDFKPSTSKIASTSLLDSKTVIRYISPRSGRSPKRKLAKGVYFSWRCPSGVAQGKTFVCHSNDRGAVLSPNRDITDLDVHEEIKLKMATRYLHSIYPHIPPYYKDIRHGYLSPIYVTGVRSSKGYANVTFVPGKSKHTHPESRSEEESGGSKSAIPKSTLFVRGWRVIKKQPFLKSRLNAVIFYIIQILFKKYKQCNFQHQPVSLGGGDPQPQLHPTRDRDRPKKQRSQPKRSASGDEKISEIAKIREEELLDEVADALIAYIDFDPYQFIANRICGMTSRDRALVHDDDVIRLLRHLQRCPRTPSGILGFHDYYEVRMMEKEKDREGADSVYTLTAEEEKGGGVGEKLKERHDHGHGGGELKLVMTRSSGGSEVTDVTKNEWGMG